MGELQQKGQLAKEASYTLAVMTTEEKNKGLLAMADALEQAMDDIMAANALDMEAAKDLGVKVIWALGLPGKVAPVTAGNIIKETICNILGELGE